MILTKYINNTFLKPENIFLLIALIFGFCFCVITPPFQIPDEINHFYRAYQISEGKLVGERKGNLLGGNLPRAIITITSICEGMPFNYNKKMNISILKRYMELKIDYSKKRFVGFSNTVLYSPIPYTGQVFGLLIGKILNSTPLCSFYIGRTTGLLLSILLLYYAIKLTPFMKWTFLYLAIMPMSVFLLPSFSTDGFTISIAFLLFSYILYLSYGKQGDISLGNIAVLCLLSILITLSKQAYFALVFLYFIIPSQKFKSIKVYFYYFLFIFILCSILIVYWTLLCKNIYIPSTIRGINPDAQALFIIKNITFFLSLSANELFTNHAIITSFVGVLGWLDAPVPVYFDFIYLILILFVTIFDESQTIKIRIIDHYIKVIVLLISIECIMALLYMSWNPVGAKEIDGLQGRYFIPISPILFSLFYFSNKISILKIKYDQIIKILIAISSVTVTTLIIVKRYYLL